MSFVRYILGVTVCILAIYGGYQLYEQYRLKEVNSGEFAQELRDSGFDVGSGDANSALSSMLQSSPSDFGTPTTPPGTLSSPGNSGNENSLPPFLRGHAGAGPASPPPIISPASQPASPAFSNTPAFPGIAIVAPPPGQPAQTPQPLPSQPIATTTQVQSTPETSQLPEPSPYTFEVVMPHATEINATPRLPEPAPTMFPREPLPETVQPPAMTAAVEQVRPLPPVEDEQDIVIALPPVGDEDKSPFMHPGPHVAGMTNVQNTPPNIMPTTVQSLPIEMPAAVSAQNQMQQIGQQPMPQPAQIAPAYSVMALPQAQDDEIAPEVAAKVAKIGELLSQGQVAMAYDQLSQMYLYDELTTEERQYVAKHLDQLAGGILFSRQHHILEPPYLVKEGDTVESIAVQYKITPELLRKLNGIANDANVAVGRELKVLRGPLDARIYPNYHEMVITMRDKYACRFPISVGSSYAGQEGSFTVQEKARNRGYQLAPSLPIIPPGDPANPLGSRWIELSKEQGTIGIHGTNNPEQIGTTKRSAGFFGLREKDIVEVYDMLTVGSQVKIVR